jgi:hypothetical protein
MTTSVSSVGASNINYSSEDPLGVTEVTPDALVEYCQMQLGNIDNQVTNQLNDQELSLSQQTAVQNVQAALDKFGDQGPANVNDVTEAIQAFQSAINQLQSGGTTDPVATELANQEQAMIQLYGYQEAPPPTVSPVTSNGTFSYGKSTSLPPSNAVAVESALANAAPTYEITAHPSSGDWKGVTDSLSNLSSNMKSDSDIQMLKLQDLVSQRQQVVELATGMMNKEDDTLTDGAKAIGQ